MLDQAMIDSVRQYMTRLKEKVFLRLQKGDHSKKAELQQFLQQVVDCSNYLQLEVGDFGLPSPISFELQQENTKTGVIFSGIPSGHEFTSLILALLQAGKGAEIKLDQSLQSMIKKINQPLNFQTYVSLSCHNCPDVVQTLNQFALLNPLITHEMIDGGLFQEKVEQLGLQGVPSVYLNGDSFANGKIDVSKLMEKLITFYPDIAQANQHTYGLQDVLVIGGGPAGVAASIYAARKGLSVMLVADRIGGQVKDTVDIENMISVPKTTGSQLAGNLLQHLKDYPIAVRDNLSVKNLNKQNDIFEATLTTNEKITSKTVIVASGAKWRELGVKGEREFLGKGVAYCPHCDGPFFKDKPVAVIGGGNSGVEAALDLAGIAEKVTVLEFADQLKADKVLVELAYKKHNIHILTGVATQEIVGQDNKVNALIYQNRADQSVHQLPIAGVFVQIGLVPNSDFLGQLVKKTQFGEIIVDSHCKTDLPGLFACGDVSTVPYKQIVIAMGEGAKAGLSAFEYLLHKCQ